MTKLVVAKFGGSAIGPNGEGIPRIIQRIADLKQNSKIIAVFSAPLTIDNDGKKRSLTDVILEQGRNAEKGTTPTLEMVRSTYNQILKLLDSENESECKKTIDINLEKAQQSLDHALEKTRICR